MPYRWTKLWPGVQGLIKKFRASAMSQAESSPPWFHAMAFSKSMALRPAARVKDSWASLGYFTNGIMPTAKIELAPLLKHGHKVIHMEDVSWSSLKVLHESGTVLSGASLCIGLLDRQQLRQRGWWKQDLGVKRVNWFASFLFKVQVSTSSRCLGKGCNFFYLILACVHSHMFHLYSFFLDLLNQFKSWLFFMLLMRLNQLINPLCIPLFDGQNPWFLGEICWDALLVTLTLTSLVAIPLHFLWMRTGRQGGVGYTWKISP